ncbi:MAG: hypothetical protein WC027_00580 [Candidatus Paceibacterota bacterium]
MPIKIRPKVPVFSEGEAIKWDGTHECFNQISRELSHTGGLSMVPYHEGSDGTHLPQWHTLSIWGSGSWIDKLRPGNWVIKIDGKIFSCSDGLLQLFFDTA